MKGSGWTDTMHGLLGKRVRVTLEAEEPQKVIEGVLLGFGDGGDVALLSADGFVYHAWPNLHIEEIA